MNIIAVTSEQVFPPSVTFPFVKVVTLIVLFPRSVAQGIAGVGLGRASTVILALGATTGEDAFLEATGFAFTFSFGDLRLCHP